jgi:cytochrome c peroxidase
VTRPTLLLALAAAALASGCADDDDNVPPGPPPPPRALGEIPPEFPPLPTPADNPFTAEKFALGQSLFFDKRLSRTGEIACGSCHKQANSFADPRRVSEGVEGRTGVRNAPPLFNLAWTGSFFWDGGVDSLERQAMAPIMDVNEMDLPLEEATARVAADPAYPPRFQAVFGTGVTPLAVTQALASFVRGLVSGDNRLDRHRRGEPHALNASERRGLAIFEGERGECFHCHTGFNLTNDRFANNGTYQPGGDVGRQRITQKPNDLGRFRVPSLRNIAVTAPYMHDGSLATLEEVIDHYDRGGLGHESTDANIHPLRLTPGEKRDLLAFLRALTDETFLADPKLSLAPAP